MSKEFQRRLHPLWTGLVHQLKTEGMSHDVTWCHMMSPTHHFRLIGSIWQSNWVQLHAPQGTAGLPEAIASGRPERCVALLRRHLAELQMGFEQNLTGQTFSGHWRQRNTTGNLSRPEGGGSKMIKGDQVIKICSKHFQATCAIIIQAASISRIQQHWNCTMLHSNA